MSDPDSAPRLDTVAAPTSLEHIVLAADEFLLLRPRRPMPPGELELIAQQIPSVMKGRVIVVEPAAFDVMVVRKIGE